MRENIGKWIVFGIVALLLAGCASAAGSSPETQATDDRLAVVATTSLVADLVQNIGGERVNIEPLMGAGVDPHLYKASAGDVRLLDRADVIFFNGLHLEAGLAEVLERMGETNQTIAVVDGIDPALLLSPPGYADSFDPHIWFDVSLWMQAAETVRDALIELDPEGAHVYQQNTQAYLTELEMLHAYVQEQINSVPQEQRVLITAHDAFSYFGRAYGFEVRGLQGISTVTEAGAGDIQELADFITERQIPAIFIESSVPRRNIEAVQAAVRSRGFEVRIGGELFSDALGTPGTPEASYLGMVRHNVDTIVAGLTQ
ncbi:MAG TPA: zinc ABC transporter substrate-binding protein [Levilinea sp.]|nr:zinc ABC transporter substrate-binding protein [Levilinea sp.]